MNTSIFIGCDIGTSGTKAVATDIHGAVLAQSHEPYGIIQLHTNWAEQDPDVWLNAAAAAIRAVVDQLPDPHAVESICISALYGGTGAMCDESMDPVRPAIIWMDRRAEKERSAIAKTIGEDSIFQISGNGIDSYFGYTKLLWVKEHEPGNWAKIRHILPIHSYIVYRMTGQITVDDCSAGNVGGIYDYSRHCWSGEMCRKLGIPFDSLPQNFHQPSDMIGTLTPEYQKKLNLNSNVSVCAGTVDCIASMLSAGIVHTGDNAAILGTSLNWGYIHKKKPDNPNLISMPYCIHPHDYSYTYGGTSTAGALPRWFAQNFMENDSAASYDTLEQMILDQKIGPGADGLIALPYFMGERTPIWDEKATGVLFGLTLTHTKAHIYRAILESVAYSLCHVMETMADTDMKLEKIVLVGGGAKSAIWKQIFADVTGLSIVTPVQEAEAPLGDAFLAAVGSGRIRDYDTIRSWIQMNPPTLPDYKNHERYKEYFSLYKELYLNLKLSMSKRMDLLHENKKENDYED